MFVRIFFLFFLFTFRMSTEWYFVRGFLSVFSVVSRFRLFFRRFLERFRSFKLFRSFLCLFEFSFGFSCSLSDCLQNVTLFVVF